MSDARATSTGSTNAMASTQPAVTTAAPSKVGLVSAVGLFVLAGFWLAGGIAIGSAQWLLADLPDADPYLLRQAVPLLVGASFGLGATVQLVLSLAVVGRPGTTAGLVLTCVGLALGMLLSLIAVGAWVSTAVEATLTNVLPSTGSLNSSGWDPARMTLVVCLLGAGVWLAPWIRLPRGTQQPR